MFDKIKNPLLIILFTSVFLLGLLSFYRASLKTKDLTVIVDNVVDKKILFFTSLKSGRHYCLAFKLANRQDEIAINLGTKNKAERDSVISLFYTGKAYKFYLDPNRSHRQWNKLGNS